MKKKPRASAKRTKRAAPSRFAASEATRTEDDRLREELRNADMKKFDHVLGKAIRPATR